LPEVKWMLHMPSTQPEIGKGSVTVANEKSWLRCRDLLSADEPAVGPSLVTQLSGDSRERTAVSRVSFVYAEQPGPLTLVHLIEVGDGAPGAAAQIAPTVTEKTVELPLGGRTYVFLRDAPYAVSVK